MILLKSENKDATTFNEVNECDDNMKMNVNLRQDDLVVIFVHKKP